MNVVSPFMSVEAVAEFLRPWKPYSVQTVYRLASEGKIPSRKHNGSRVFHRAEIEAWSASQAESKKACLTAFEQARIRVRSLKTEHTVKRPYLVQRGQG